MCQEITSANRDVSSERIHEDTCRAAASSPALLCSTAFLCTAKGTKGYQWDENINVGKDYTDAQKNADL